MKGKDIQTPVFDNSSRKYDDDFAHEELSFFSPNNILCVLRVCSPINIENNYIIKAFLSIIFKHGAKPRTRIWGNCFASKHLNLT